MSASVLVTKPGSLMLADKAVLRQSGIVVVEAENPADVKLIQMSGQELSGSALLYAAMQALNAPGYGSDVREAFSKAVMAELQTQREIERGQLVKLPPRDAGGKFAKASGK